VATTPATSMPATTSFTSVTAPAATTPIAAKLGNVAYIGRVLFQVAKKSANNAKHAVKVFSSSLMAST
jgi:hypothetical protein